MIATDLEASLLRHQTDLGTAGRPDTTRMAFKKIPKSKEAARTK